MITDKLFIFILLFLSSLSICSKLFFLSTGRVGTVVMYTNVLFETWEKKVGTRRNYIDAVLLLSLSFGWTVTMGPYVGLLFALVFSGAWVYALHEDLELRTNNPGKQEDRFGPEEVPLPNPRLICTLRGPILIRGRYNDLGDWPVGHNAEFQLMILNSSILLPQFPLNIEFVSSSDHVHLQSHFPPSQRAPKPGEYVIAAFELKASTPTDEPFEIKIQVSLGSYQVHQAVRIHSVFDLSSSGIENVTIDRWKGGALAAFAWRGDMDMYDPGTFQSVEGLKIILELSRRYRVPSTMFLSGRLSFVKEEHEEFCKKLGVDRQTGEIDNFIDFLKNEVNLEAAIDFPYNTARPYAMEVGNHMYLHYGTNAAMAAGNQWRMGSWIGEGTYPWQTEEAGSFAEQRDNAKHNVELIKELLGVEVKTWGVPGRVYDEYTARAVEAAGMEVGSDTNASAYTNVLGLPPPHHPEGCKRLVELTKKYPGDPDNAYKVAMLKYWIGRALRERKAFIYMTHHHALRYKGIACLHMTEEILRHVVQDYNGAFYISTLYGLGYYWDRVLCPKHGWVKASINKNGQIEIQNRGEELLDGIPVEITFTNGKRMLILATLPSQRKTILTIIGKPVH